MIARQYQEVDVAVLHILSLPALGTLKQTVLGSIGSQMLSQCERGVVFVEYPVYPSACPGPPSLSSLPTG